MYALNDHECELLNGGLTIIGPTTNVSSPIVNTSIVNVNVIQQNVAATIAVINSRASNAQANGNITRIRDLNPFLLNT
jgi:hypothetical protein